MLKMLKWLLANPFKSIGAACIVGSTLFDIYLRPKAEKELLLPVYQKLISGSKSSMPFPNCNTTAVILPRPQVSEDIARMFLPEPKEANFMHFGIIIGPSRSGKTYMVMELCNKSPEGVLYHEISMPDKFVTDLSKDIGMKISPSTALDLAVSYISQAYCHYHIFPKSQKAGLGEVLAVLERLLPST